MGQFHKKDMEMTLSEAINIQVPYNFERFFHYLAEEDATKVREWMATMEATGRLTLSTDLHAVLAQGMGSCRVPDDEMLATMRRAWELHGYLTDPHTAVALAAVRRWYGMTDKLTFPPGKQEVPLVALSTAHAAKFEEAMRRGLGDAFWERSMGAHMPARAKELEMAKEVDIGLFRKGEDWTSRLRELIEAAEMRSAL